MQEDRTAQNDGIELIKAIWKLAVTATVTAESSESKKGGHKGGACMKGVRIVGSGFPEEPSHIYHSQHKI